ncbi:MAG TPA: tRNA (N(6)-L-threonylcarbamoyladenosine(37)-C(2))-methylthiotransferase MtaB, partial [Solibacterales bacterium]|nr:tRNA (N(6)-L-threonylcarbamoyladenosine(37)-C(2))-methylthiotransferase MtaB [Bryobacterales bacterium]
IPSVRGPNRFAPADQVVQQVAQLARTYREVVLTGINLGRWGREAFSEMRLVDLLRRLLDETSIERLRLSSVEPMDFSDALLQLMSESPRIAPHVHAPLQSGSDFILRRMHRKYRPQHYADRVLRARRLMPMAAIGADVMVGFPGETERHFEESKAFIEALPFTYLHVFTYSERPGTPAAAMPGAVPMETRRARNQILREISERKNREFRLSQVGRTVKCVTLETPGLGMSENYLTVELNQWSGANRMLDARVGTITPHGVREQSLLPVL